MPKLFPIPFRIGKSLWLDVESGKPRKVGCYWFRRTRRELTRHMGDLWIGLYWKRKLEEIDEGGYYGEFSLYWIILPTLVYQVDFAVSEFYNK